MMKENEVNERLRRRKQKTKDRDSEKRLIKENTNQTEENARKCRYKD